MLRHYKYPFYERRDLKDIVILIIYRQGCVHEFFTVTDRHSQVYRPQHSLEGRSCRPENRMSMFQHIFSRDSERRTLYYREIYVAYPQLSAALLVWLLQEVVP